MVKFELENRPRHLWCFRIWSNHGSAEICWFLTKHIDPFFKTTNKRNWYWRYRRISFSIWFVKSKLKLKFKVHKIYGLDYGKYSNHAIGTVVKDIKKYEWGWFQVKGPGRYVS